MIYFFQVLAGKRSSLSFFISFIFSLSIFLTSSFLLIKSLPETSIFWSLIMGLSLIPLFFCSMGIYYLIKSQRIIHLLSLQANAGLTLEGTGQAYFDLLQGRKVSLLSETLFEDVNSIIQRPEITVDWNIPQQALMAKAQENFKSDNSKQSVA